MKLSGKKFLVIGGAGLIGSHTVEQLLSHDVEEVIIYDNFERGRVENLTDAFKIKGVVSMMLAVIYYKLMF